MQRRMPAEWKVSAASLQSPLALTIECDAQSGEEVVREYFGVFRQTENAEKFAPDRWTQRTPRTCKKIGSLCWTMALPK